MVITPDALCDVSGVGTQHLHASFASVGVRCLTGVGMSKSFSAEEVAEIREAFNKVGE